MKYRELARVVGTDHGTVKTYIAYLEEMDLFFRLCPYQKSSARAGSVHGYRYYFYDCGVRNAVIEDFRPLELRQDVQAIWENFVINERMKLHRVHPLFLLHPKSQGRRSRQELCAVGSPGPVYYYLNNGKGTEGLDLMEVFGDHTKRVFRIEWIGRYSRGQSGRNTVCLRNIERFI